MPRLETQISKRQVLILVSLRLVAEIITLQFDVCKEKLASHAKAHAAWGEKVSGDTSQRPGTPKEGQF